MNASLRGSNTPVSVERPSALLAFLAAVLGASAASTLGELPRVLLPLPTLVEGTLTNAPSSIVLPAQVPHNDPGPILHVGAVVPDSELLH